MNKFLTSFYNASPVFFQNILISAYGYKWKERRLGGIFKKELKKFKERENFSYKDWEKYQVIELRKLLTHAFKTVPFYHKLYKECGFKLSDFEKFELSDIKKLPYLEKEDLRRFGKTTLLSTSKEKGNFYSSSGSTGTPVDIYFSKKTHQKWFAAYEVRVLNWAGVSIKLARGMIGGRRIINKSKPKPPYYRYNMAEKQTYFSAYHLNKNTLANYLFGMKKNNVEFMVGYAMSNYFLAKLFVENKIKPPKIKAVITSSEKLTQDMRAIFKKAYGCKTYDSYSGMEACGLISENSEGDFLFSPDTGIVELINEKNEEVKDGNEGEVVLTGLLNFDQPLIRYRIGDRATKKENQKAISKKQMPLFKEINGRVEDVIIGLDKTKIVRFHGLYINIIGLVVGQIIQESHLDFVINLVVDDDYLKTSELIISKRLKSQLGPEINISFNYLSDIPKNKNGKFRAVINNLS
ncbi:hypothetical protein [uncultured Polaribacter sp.]|uniref:hypothetical protein n=1 Tax=uncultured Polaribacter sp. TaxID=174711 RepID=UPI0026160711|nr:hypothetical protein [uncultured Polaribacter sp.]